MGRGSTPPRLFDHMTLSDAIGATPNGMTVWRTPDAVLATADMRSGHRRAAAGGSAAQLCRTGSGPLRGCTYRAKVSSAMGCALTTAADLTELAAATSGPRSGPATLHKFEGALRRLGAAASGSAAPERRLRSEAAQFGGATWSLGGAR